MSINNNNVQEKDSFKCNDSPSPSPKYNLFQSKGSNSDKLSEEEEPDFMNFPQNPPVSEPPNPEMNMNCNSNNNHQNPIQVNEVKDKIAVSNIFSNSTINETPILNGSTKPEIIPNITNMAVVGNFNCKFDIKRISDTLKMKIINNYVSLRVKNSNSNLKLHATGTMILVGIKNKEELKEALKLYKRDIKSCGYPEISINMNEIKYKNIAASCDVKFKISLKKLFFHLRNLDPNSENSIVSYNTELFPALIYKKNKEESKVTFEIFASGKINITGAKKEEHIHETFKEIYPELLKNKDLNLFKVNK